MEILSNRHNAAQVYSAMSYKLLWKNLLQHIFNIVGKQPYFSSLCKCFPSSLCWRQLHVVDCGLHIMQFWLYIVIW